MGEDIEVVAGPVEHGQTAKAPFDALRRESACELPTCALCGIQGG